ncbi:MAG: type VI secretion system tip protein VgrG [Acidobacteria bacterium]|nr:type VI secretion system tip protein VgrG [Acidobacteriota bacterium]
MSISASFESVGSLAPGLGSDGVPYRLAVSPFPPGHFQVRSFRGRERLSKPYAFDITVTTGMLVGEDLERLALGQRAAFVMTLDGVTRVVPGIIASVRSEGVRPAFDAAQYRLRLVPALWRLGRRKGSRIFQDLRVDEVVEAVLREAGVASRWQLSRAYPARPYCTQYQESDLAFITRLLAEAGIFYYFAPPLTGLEGLLGALLGAAVPGASAAGDALAFAGAAAGLFLPEETVVLSDDPACYAPLPTGGLVGAVAAVAGAAGVAAGVSVGPLTLSMPSPTLHYLGEHGFATGRSDKVTALVAERRVRSNVAEYRDFDPERPAAPIVARDGDRRAGGAGGVAGGVMAAAEGALAEASVALELDLEDGPSLSASVGAAAMGALATLLERRDLETYEHHGRFLYPDWEDLKAEPGRMRRLRRRRAVTASGESLCHAFAPGHRFHLADHPVGPFNREWAIVGVRHTGNVAEERELYGNAFECVPSNVAFPPKRTDPDAPRAPLPNLTATVAGPAGEEIHVDAAGRIKVLFHWDRRGAAEHPSSWLRVMQPWGGAGWGHQFIPRIGMEVVVAFDGGDPDKPMVIGSLYNGTHPPAFPLPAQKTRSGLRTQSTPHAVGYNELSFEDAAGREQVYLRAERDLDELVRRNHTLEVGGDEVILVKGLRKDEVVEDLFEIAHADKDVKVRGNQATVVEKSLLETVDANADYLVHGVRHSRVDGRDELEVGGPAAHRFEQDLVTRVLGNHTVIVGQNDQKRSFTLRVEGTTTLSSEDALVLECPKGITLSCGTSSLRIGPDGIELVGDMVRAAGKKGGLEANAAGVTIRSEGAFAQLGDKLHLQTAGTSLTLGKTELKADATKILFNSPERATEEPAPRPAEMTVIELVDDANRPVANAPFVVDLEDGTRRSGVTDKNGRCQIDLPSDGSIRFLDTSDATVE